MATTRGKIMDRMIFCHGCKIEEMIDDYYSDEWKCPKCNQPERSKREDCDRCNKLKQPLNDCCRIEISQMRCSEHCGNTVREVQ